LQADFQFIPGILMIIFFIGIFIVIIYAIIKHFKGKRDYDKNEKHGTKYTGRVRNFTETSIPWGQRTKKVWNFKVAERGNDQWGNHLPDIPVQMRGDDLENFFSEGDKVTVKGIWTEGKTLYVDRLTNESTKVEVIVKAAY
jgi:hypothetical protein